MRMQTVQTIFSVQQIFVYLEAPSNEQIPGCCGANGDCDDGVECTSDICDVETGTCSSEAIEGCCQVDEDCDDGNLHHLRLLRRGLLLHP